MLVFRCECEQVLGVEDESQKGGMGACPTCGRIIRVPVGLVNAAGRLRLAGSPARASATSGAFRQVKDSAKVAANGMNGSNGSGGPPLLSPASIQNDVPVKPAAPEKDVATAKTATDLNVSSVEPLIPLPSKSATPDVKSPAYDFSPEAPTAETIKAVSPQAAAVAPNLANDFPAPPTKTAPIPARSNNANNKNQPSKKQQPTQKSAPPKPDPAKMDANDPSAALETKNDKNLAAAANAAASKRKKPEPVAPPAAGKKSFMLIYMIIVAILVIAAGTLYAMGFFNGEPKNTDTKPANTPAMKTETKPAPTPDTKGTPTPDTKADPAAPKPPDNANPTPQPDGEKKPDDKKPEEKKPDDAKTNN